VRLGAWPSTVLPVVLGHIAVSGVDTSRTR
jgi:hypothetical protein